MSTAISTLILIVISILLESYGTLAPALWINKRKKNIHEPFIGDLIDTSDRDTVKRYGFEIRRYHEYLILKQKIESFSRYDGAISTITGILCMISTGASLDYIFEFNVDISFYLLFIVIPFLVAVLMGLSYFIFYKMFPQPEFDVSKQIEEYEANDAPSQFPISKEDDLNIFLISRHYQFLSSIYEREKAQCMRRITGCVFAIIALLISIFELT